MNATSNQYQVSIEVDPVLPTIRVTRDFDATPAQLLRGHTGSEMFAQWVCPNGVDSFEGRDQWLASGMETGVSEGYVKLDALIGELR